jgi:hypothetical protein
MSRLSLKSLFCPVCFPWGTGSSCQAHEIPLVERWAKKVSQLTSPDEIIVARITQSFATDITAWECSCDLDELRCALWIRANGRVSLIKPDQIEKLHRDDRFWQRVHGIGKLSNEKSSLEVLLKIDYKQSRRRAFYDYEVIEFSVNGDELDKYLGWMVWESYCKINDEYVKAQEVAAKAKKDMEANERKWDLAERLLGMKRLPTGALVPVDKYPEAVASLEAVRQDERNEDIIVENGVAFFCQKG